MNHPLRIQGDRVYLIGHGFAPELTFHMPDGSVRHDVAVFAPQDPSTLLSEGVFKEPGPNDKNEDIGVSGLFAPTPAFQRHGGHVHVAAGQQPGAGDQGLSGRPELPGLSRSRSTRWTRPR